MNNVVVVVSKPHGIQLPPVSSEKPEEQKGLMLLPGENDVTAGAWEAAKKNPCIEVQIRAGHLKCQGVGKAVPIVLDWSRMPLDKLRGMVDRSVDIERLQEIKGRVGKKRKDIIDSRIEEIMTDNKDVIQ